MSFPPALTWLELLPNHTPCTCESGPQWLRAQLSKHATEIVTPSASASPARVIWGQPNEPVDHLQTVIAINAPGALAKFQQSGFNYIRRLAVLPSFDNP